MTKARDLASGGFGLVLVKPSSVVGGTDNGKGTVSFSASTSISLNNVFSSIYDRYKVTVRLTSGSATGNLYMRFRVSNSDDSSNAYRRAGYYSSMESNLSGLFGNEVATYYNLGNFLNGSYPLFCDLDINQPFQAAQKNMITSHVSNSGVWTSVHQNGVFTNSTSFTGLTVYTSTGNVTGSISVYGFNN